MDILHRVGADGRSRQLVVGHLRVVQDNPSVKRHDTVRPGEQGIDVDFLDSGLFDDKLAEAHHQPFQRIHVHGFAPAHALQRLEDLGPLHHAPGQRGVERRQTERPILEDLDQRTAAAKEQDGTKLAVLAAPDDQLIAVELDHGLNSDALEVLRAVAFG